MHLLTPEARGSSASVARWPPRAVAPWVARRAWCRSRTRRLSCTTSMPVPTTIMCATLTPLAHAQPTRQPRRAHVHPLTLLFLSLHAIARLRAGVRVAPCIVLRAAAEAAPVHRQRRAPGPPSERAVHRVASHDHCEAVRRARLPRHRLGAVLTDTPRARAPRLRGVRLAPAAGHRSRAARRAVER